MTDAAPDKENRSHGVLWYATWIMFLYVVCSLPLYVALSWLNDHGIISDYWAVIFFPFVPLAMVVDIVGESVGSGPLFSDAVNWMRSMLP